MSCSVIKNTPQQKQMDANNTEHSIEQLIRIGRVQDIPDDAYQIHERYCRPIDRQEFLKVAAGGSRTQEQVKGLCSQEFFKAIFESCKKQRETENFTQLKQCIEADLVCDVLIQLIKQLVDVPNVEEIMLSPQAGHLNTEGLSSCIIDGKVQMFYPEHEQLQNRGNRPQLLIVGDTHGTIEIVEWLFNTYGYPWEAESPIYVFNGDYVDRGSFGVEIFTVLAICKLAHPERVYLTRGNHESKSTCSNYSFQAEVFMKYWECGSFKRVFELFLGAFMTLPLAVSVQRSVLVLHGGVNPGSILLTKALERVERRREPCQRDGVFLSDPLNDFLWSDPSDLILEAQFNQQRQTGAFFGKNGVARFLSLQSHSLLIRSHTCCDLGFEKHHSGRTWTVFSVPNYADSNVGAVLEVSCVVSGLPSALGAPGDQGAAIYSAEAWGATSDRATPGCATPDGATPGGATSIGATQNGAAAGGAAYGTTGALECAFNQFTTSEWSAIDRQIFFNQRIISSYASLGAAELRQLPHDTERLKMFFALFSMGYIDANIGSPKRLTCLVSKEGVKIPLLQTLLSHLGQTKVVDALHSYLQDNQMDVTEMLCVYEWKEQADAVMLLNAEHSLQEAGINMPEGLFNSNIPQQDIEKIMATAAKAVRAEERRREKRKLQKERWLKQRQKNQKRLQKNGK